jgi:predicted phosphoribosyltransferase
MGFRDRRDAGKRLAELLMAYKGRNDVHVLALPRGGIPVGYEISKALEVPMDVFLVRKLGVPGHEELAMGAIAEGGFVYTNENVIHALNVAEPVIHTVMRREQEELERRVRQYRGNEPLPNIRDQIILLVDDGLATGASMLVAARAIREMEPMRLVVAIPVAPPESCEMLQREADEVICALTPTFFTSVGSWYEDFTQTTDEEVEELLSMARKYVHTTS